VLVILAFVSCVGLLDSKRDPGDTGDRFVGAYVEVEETCAPGGVVLDCVACCREDVFRRHERIRLGGRIRDLIRRTA
jgi:hypothetical protein